MSAFFTSCGAQVLENFQLWPWIHTQGLRMQPEACVTSQAGLTHLRRGIWYCLLYFANQLYICSVVKFISEVKPTCYITVNTSPGLPVCTQLAGSTCVHQERGINPGKFSKDSIAYSMLWCTGEWTAWGACVGEAEQGPCRQDTWALSTELTLSPAIYGPFT